LRRRECGGGRAERKGKERKAEESENAKVLK
jgi:hypothetical protein